MKRYLASLTLILYSLSGLAEHSSAVRLDQSILNRYQTKTSLSTTSEPPGLSQEIKTLYQKLANRSDQSMLGRLTYFSEYFLGKPYVLFPLGEGYPSRYDEMPRVRLDAFDCETYVDTVLALSLAKQPNAFKHCLDKIRYQDGHVSFTTRNHFTSRDWNQHNQKNGYLKDITTRLVDSNNQPVAKYASTTIDKKGWYRKLPLSFIRIQTLDMQVREKRLKALHAEGEQFKAEQVIVPYITLEQLTGKNGTHLLRQIPSGAIIEIVRPDWHLKSIIGTDLDISHLGFAFWKDNVLYFRQASSSKHQVIDVPLSDYLHELSKNPTIGGINIQIVKPSTPRAAC